jgi:solute carrier family 35 protein E3
MPTNTIIGIGLIVNLVSSVGIVQINKYIYTKLFFSNMCLTCVHFLVTSMCLVTLCWIGAFKFAQVSLKKMIPMSLTFCASVVLTNYSLQFNSIGTYQCLKALSTPCVMVITIFFYKHEYSFRVKFSVVSQFYKNKKKIYSLCF